MFEHTHIHKRNLQEAITETERMEKHQILRSYQPILHSLNFVIVNVKPYLISAK